MTKNQSDLMVRISLNQTDRFELFVMVPHRFEEAKKQYSQGISALETAATKVHNAKEALSARRPEDARRR